MFRTNSGLLWAAAVAVGLAASVQATEWVADFTSTSPESFTGTDNNAVASYTDTLGGNANSYKVTYSLNGSAPSGWLTQGSRGSVPTTAKFWNPPGDGLGGRARFSTALPTSMDANGGVAFAWTARYGNYAMGRAPIQLCVTDTGGLEGTQYNAYIRVQNGTTLAIQSNGGGLYTTIDPLTIANVADGQYHQWSASVITSGTLAHWKLFLNGTQLLFTGDDGAHQFDPGTGPQQFSFQTGSNPFSGDPYIGLGDLQTGQDQWDFEFDCVAYKDDGVADNYTCGTAVVTCDSSVTPAGTQNSTALRNSPATPASFTYTFTNTGSSNNGYTVAETDAAGVPMADPGYAWLLLDKTGSASPLGPMASEDVLATITDTSMAGGLHTAYITFTDTCNPANKHVRRIDLTVIDCRSAVSPATNAGRAFLVGSVQTPAPVIYTFENTGAPPVSYTITSDASWLQLDKPTGVPIGPIAPGGSDVVTGTINVAGLAPGGHAATLTFTDTCDPTVQHVRQVLLSVDEPIATSGDTLQQFKAEFTEFTASDLASQSPLESCDPGGTTDRVFSVGYNSVDSLPAGWLTQGTIDDTPTTAKFNNPDDDLAGRVRFRTFLPFDNTFAPAKGMAVAWNMRIGTDGNARGPIQITFPRVTGPFGTDDATSAVAGEVFNAYVRVNDDAVRILNNGGTAIATIGELTLGTPIAGEYHQWTAAVCYNDADQMAYWNLWLDGEKLMFDGADGSVVGPGGDIFSFRTGLNDVSGDPYVGLGELNSGEDVWDFEFDWVRMLSYNVNGCPFWDGGGSCFSTLPWPDADEDGDVDQADFAVFQLCFSGDGNALSDPATCRRFNRDGDSDVDSLDFNKFEKCATGPGIALDPENPPTGCEL
ncbi:MAG: hypothetical protein QUV05_14950 [Phycisphaerae bacterium]|nr:hypothetical protein [Phycisphaerae bacterium]